MNENHSYGCYDDQVAMGLHDLSKAQIVYPEPTALEQKADNYLDKVPISDVVIKGLIKQAYIAGATEETKLLSEHILELQNDKGRLTDENKEAREIIKGLIQYGVHISTDDYVRAEQFLGDEKCRG